ncbi:MAG: acyltransferase [Thermoplasmatota archaeon]
MGPVNGILSLIKTKNGESLLERIRFIGLKATLHSFILQRLFRVNSHVPWPVDPSSRVAYPKKITIAGSGTCRMMIPYLGFMPGSYFQGMNGIIVGRNLRLGPGVKMISANHDLADFDNHPIGQPIRIGDNCWIGSNAVILPGVELADHTVVGAGSVVTRSVREPNTMVAGIPAKKVRDIQEYSGENTRAWA